MRPLARPKAETPSRLRTGARASLLRMRAGVQQLYQCDEKRRSLELEEIKLAMCRGIFQVDPVTVVAAASQAPVISRSRAGPGHS